MQIFENNVLLWFIAVVVGTLISILIAPLRDFFAKILVDSFKWVWASLIALPKYLSLRSFVLKRKPLWKFRRAGSLRLENSPPVLTVMNFKGGVGKTTIAANLAASLALNHGMRVLLVDLDYQGSLSDLLRENTVYPDDENLLNDWLTRRTSQLSLEQATTAAKGLENVKLVSAEYALTEAEDNEFLRWLIGESSDDVRNRIARRLSSKKHNYKGEFDIVIMDAPPRLSLASANALRASHFVLIPTKLQPLSVLPIAKMTKYISEFRDQIKAKFELIGIVCSMTAGLAPSS